jgi:hypothetical protein
MIKPNKTIATPLNISKPILFLRLQALRPSHIAGLRLSVPRAGVFESQPLAHSDSVRIYSGRLQLADVQKHIRTTGVVCDKSEAAVGVPHFQFAGGQSISPSP